MEFSSTDGSATVPADAPLVSGTQTFVGSGFTLATSGTQTVSVNHAVQTEIKATTGNITVSSAGIATFTLSEPGTVTAGVPFTLTVSNARDAQNNLADGLIAVTFNDAGAHLAPDTTAPTPDPDYTVRVTVTGYDGGGAPNGQSAFVDLVLELRPLGDVEGDLDVDQGDQLQINNALNDLTLGVGVTTRHLNIAILSVEPPDTIDQADKLLINQVLNDLPVN